MAQRVKHLPSMWETRVRFLGRKDLLEKKRQPTPIFLPGKSHGLRSLVGYRPLGWKESDTTEQLSLSRIGIYMKYSLTIYHLSAVNLNTILIQLCDVFTGNKFFNGKIEIR